jgi:hypothetical protein
MNAGGQMSKRQKKRSTLVDGGVPSAVLNIIQHTVCLIYIPTHELALEQARDPYNIIIYI